MVTSRSKSALGLAGVHTQLRIHRHLQSIEAEAAGAGAVTGAGAAVSRPRARRLLAARAGLSLDASELHPGAGAYPKRLRHCRDAPWKCPFAMTTPRPVPM